MLRIREDFFPRTLLVYENLDSYVYWRCIVPAIKLAEQSYPIGWVNDLSIVSTDRYDQIIVFDTPSTSPSFLEKVISFGRSEGKVVAVDTVTRPLQEQAHAVITSDLPGKLQLDTYVEDLCWVRSPRWSRAPLTMGLISYLPDMDWSPLLEPVTKIAKKYDIHTLVQPYEQNFEDVAAYGEENVQQDYKAMMRLKNNIDIMICPTESQIDIYEAGLVGAAVVSPYTIRTSTGSIVQDNDWYTAIEALLKNPEKMQQKAQALRQEVLTRHSYTKGLGNIIRTWREVYHRTVGVCSKAEAA